MRTLSKIEIKQIATLQEELQQFIDTDSVNIHLDIPKSPYRNKKSGEVLGIIGRKFCYVYPKWENQFDLFEKIGSTVESLLEDDIFFHSNIGGNELIIIDSHTTNKLINNELRKVVELIYSEEKKPAQLKSENNNSKFFTIFSKKEKTPFLIDFDGVINLYGNPAPYSKEFFGFLRDQQIPSFILSNSTLKTADDIKDFLVRNQLPSDIPIMTAVDAALKYVEKNYKKVSVYCVENVKKEFHKFIDDVYPEAVVIGDLVDGWSVDILNEIFLKVYNGADLVAMHMNRYWSPEENKKVLDVGSFISAIEYATSKKSTLIGKPSPIYFETALEKLNHSKGLPFLMLGDDIDLDIVPVNKMRGHSILILTGKTNLPLPRSASPKFIAKDLSEVIEILKNCYAIN